MENNLEKIVFLIDADNTQLAKLGAVIREISTHGRIVVKRAYGNWKKDALKNWEDELKRLAIKAEQQFDYVTRKNATDMALVIDAMDLLHKQIYDAFVIVASDSDYTPLAIHLHEAGVYVLGVGEKKTPESFKNSCDEFIFLENLDSTMKKSSSGQANAKSGGRKSGSAENRRGEQEDKRAETEDKREEAEDKNEEIEDKHEDIEEIHSLLKIASDKYQDNDGYVNISAAGNYIKRVKPDFDVRTYGFSKLPQLIEAFPQKYEMTKFQGKGTVKIVAYKCRE